jgi:hypothetical protein
MQGSGKGKQMVRVWEDQPKRGETYGGWFASVSRDGHIFAIQGGFADYHAALAWGHARL